MIYTGILFKVIVIDRYRIDCLIQGGVGGAPAFVPSRSASSAVSLEDDLAHDRNSYRFEFGKGIERATSRYET